MSKATKPKTPIQLLRKITKYTSLAFLCPSANTENKRLLNIQIQKYTVDKAELLLAGQLALVFLATMPAT